MNIYVGEDNCIHVNFNYQYKGYYRVEATLPTIGDRIVWKTEFEDVSDIGEYFFTITHLRVNTYFDIEIKIYHSGKVVASEYFSKIESSKGKWVKDSDAEKVKILDNTYNFQA